MTTAENLGTCCWCGYDRPDHKETCPVRQLAEGLAKTMTAPIGAVTMFHASAENPAPPTWRYPRTLWPTGQTRDACSWQKSSTDARIVGECGCGTHTGEPMTLIDNLGA